MRKAKFSFVVVIAGAAAGLLLLSSTPASSQAKNPKLVERGNYLATMFGCKDCHTPGFFYGAPDSSRELSGSEVGWFGPWGTTYPLNLTPDPETGLGKWTDADIEKALRTGVRPDGTVLRPPMPWPHYAKMTDEDMKALIAYLRSIPAVKHAEPPALPPNAKPTGSFIALPPPPAWDAPRKAGAEQPTPETRSRASEELEKGKKGKDGQKGKKQQQGKP